jgi:hypothetical protein
VDDTGARHKAINGFCTQIGNDDFTCFDTTGSKSRLNFLEVLRAGYSDYVINAEALAYMRERALARHVIDRLAEHPDRHFSDEKAWNVHLDALGITTLPGHVQVATEGALSGSVKTHGLLPNTVIVSDDAGQFNVGSHGLCWVHAERLIHKLDTFTEHTASRRPLSASRSGNSTLTSRLGVALPPRRARLRCRRGSTISSPRRPASSPSTACLRGFMPTSLNCCWCSSGPKSRCTPTDRKTTSAVTSPDARSAAAPAAAATTATPSLDLPKPAPNLQSHSGTIWGDRLAVPGAKAIPWLPELVIARAQAP